MPGDAGACWTEVLKERRWKVARGGVHVVQRSSADIRGAERAKGWNRARLWRAAWLPTRVSGRLPGTNDVPIVEEAVVLPISERTVCVREAV